MSRECEPGNVVAFVRTDSRREEKRQAKAGNLRQRFAAARSASEPKSKAAERLKKLFKNPGRNPSKTP
jgi:hypothetical protein